MMTGPEQDAIKDMLDSLIRQSAPNVSTVPKYGGILYTLHPEEKEDQFCGVFAYKDHVQLAFSLGTSLNDPQNLLQGTGKYRRHLNFSSVVEIDAEAVTRFLRQAVTL